MPLSAIQPAHYETLLQEKVAGVKQLLSPFSPPDPEVIRSAATGFRLRAEFRMWHEGDDLNYVMFRRGEPKDPISIAEFVIADQQIQALMPVLRKHLASTDILRRKLFQVEFLATLSGDMLVSLIYHRKLDEEWETTANSLIAALRAEFPRLSIVGRSRKQKVILGNGFVRETLTVDGKDYNYQQFEQSFTQPNGQVNIRMIEWACEHAKGSHGDLLELYCGNGNFTLPLSRHYDNVIATELSKTSVRSARVNIDENNIENIQLVRLSAEEVTQAMNAERTFRRLSELPQPLEQYCLDTIFVDPPRAGLDEHTVAMAAGFESIIYISCNPQTLAENLAILCKTHRIQAFALFDQFPYTDHMECGVFLIRQPATEN